MNLVRMNLYRFVRTKAVYVLLIITVLFMGLIILDQKSMSEEAWEAEMELLQAEGIDVDDTDENVGITFGMTPITSASAMTESLVSSGLLLVFTGIFAALFSNAERNGGYLKNLNSCAENRGQIFMAKGAPVAVFVLLSLLIVPLTSVALGLEAENIFSKELILYILVQWLLHLAYGIFVLTVMEVSRSLVVGMLVGIFCGIGVGVVLLSFIENAFRVNGLISSHMIVYIVRGLMLKNVMECLLPALLAGTIGFILYWIVGTLVFEKRDMY